MSVAEDIFNGECCSECNVYFEKEHGYPILCDDCYNENYHNNISLHVYKEIGEIE